MKREAWVEMQRRRLAEWLREWQLAQRLDAAPEPSDGAPGAAADLSYPAGPARRCAGSPLSIGDPSRLQDGEVVLLAPESETTRRRPVYVALIELTRGGDWLTVPFGRFALPAVPGELATRRAAPSLRVLCVWNAGPIDGARLARGWSVGHLTPRELGWVRLLLEKPAGAPPPRALAGRLGPPLVHPLDPRHDYLEEERLLWIDDAVPGTCGDAQEPYEAELPLAAEHRTDYWERK